MVRVRKATQDDAEEKKHLTGMPRHNHETRAEDGIRFIVSYLERVLLRLVVDRTEFCMLCRKNRYSVRS